MNQGSDFLKLVEDPLSFKVVYLHEYIQIYCYFITLVIDEN